MLPEIKYDENGAPFMALTADDTRPKPPRRPRRILVRADLAEPPEGYVFADELRAKRRAERDEEIEVVQQTRGADRLARDDNQSHHAPEPEEVVSMSFSDDLTLANALTPVREAQQLLGAPVIGSGLTIVKDPDGGRGRFVYTRKLNELLNRPSRGGRATGAGTVAADAISDAQSRRAQANARGQANDRTTTRDARSKRYGTAKLSGRD